MPVLLSAIDYVIAGHVEHPSEKPGSPEFWWKIGLSALLVVAGGVFAGYVTHLLNCHMSIIHCGPPVSHSVLWVLMCSISVYWLHPRTTLRKKGMHRKVN
jgi:hypothetical protein